MDSKEHLARLFDYNDWANRRLIALLKTAPCEPALGYISHIVLAEREYYERLHGKDSTGFDFWQKLSIDECRSLAQETGILYEKLLANFDDEGLGQVAHYYTSRGMPVKNTFREVLTQVILHSMNHRGQALTALRREGFEPPMLDYIIYCRSIS